MSICVQTFIGENDGSKKPCNGGNTYFASKLLVWLLLLKGLLKDLCDKMPLLALIKPVTKLASESGVY